MASVRALITGRVKLIAYLRCWHISSCLLLSKLHKRLSDLNNGFGDCRLVSPPSYPSSPRRKEPWKAFIKSPSEELRCIHNWCIARRGGMLPRPQVILTPPGGRIWAPSLQARPVQGARAPRGGDPSTLSSRPPRLQGAEMLYCVQHDMGSRLRCPMDPNGSLRTARDIRFASDPGLREGAVPV